MHTHPALVSIDSPPYRHAHFRSFELQLERIALHSVKITLDGHLLWDPAVLRNLAARIARTATGTPFDDSFSASGLALKKMRLIGWPGSRATFSATAGVDRCDAM